MSSKGGTRGLGAGYVHERVIKALMAGARSTEDVERAVKDQISGDALLAVLKRMERAGWVVRSRSQLWPTYVGKMACLPSQSLGEPPKWAQTTYTPPPAAPRRDGSDYTVYPSLVGAGRLQEYRPHA
jgi:hypothetical protein